MKQLVLICALALAPSFALAQAITADIVNNHVLPRFATLAETSQTLAKVGVQDCSPTSKPLRIAYGRAFDAWIAASHMRFGPTETDDRAFALAFWPDSRGATPKTLGGLVQCYNTQTLALIDRTEISDACGIAATSDGIVVTTGTGQLLNLTSPQVSDIPTLKWDNHLVVLH
ncbi:MAG: DUF1513 domain-containing protein [Pseudomonadota bacterium]